MADFLKSQYHGYSGKEWYKCYKNVTIAQDNKQRLNIMNIWKSWHYSSLKNIEYLENIEWKTETNLERMRRPIILSVVNVRILSLDIVLQYYFPLRRQAVVTRRLATSSNGITRIPVSTINKQKMAVTWLALGCN